MDALNDIMQSQEEIPRIKLKEETNPIQISAKDGSTNEVLKLQRTNQKLILKQRRNPVQKEKRSN
jgi:hypothetical protein